MDNLNSVLLEGNLVKDPDLKHVGEDERPVCRFSIGVNRYRKDDKGEIQQFSTFVDVEAWGALAENCGKYLRKGRGVRVVGSLKQESWTGKEDGKTHSRLLISASHIEFRPEVRKTENAEEIVLEEESDISEEAQRG